MLHNHDITNKGLNEKSNRLQLSQYVCDNWQSWLFKKRIF